MFTSDDVQARMRERPFVPVRFEISSGQSFDVYHPDMVIVAKRFVFVGVPSSDNAAQAEQVTRLAILHVTEMLDLPVSTSQA